MQSSLKYLPMLRTKESGFCLSKKTQCLYIHLLNSLRGSLATGKKGINWSTWNSSHFHKYYIVLASSQRVQNGTDPGTDAAHLV